MRTILQTLKAIYLELTKPNSKSLILVPIAILISLLTWFYKADESWVGTLRSNVVIRGFPFHFFENRFLFIWYILDALFWLAATVSIWRLFFSKDSKSRARLLRTTLVVGFVLMMIGSNTGSCDGGFPIVFYSICDEGNLGALWTTYALIFNTAFWFIIGSISVVFLNWASHLEDWSKYVLIPIFLSLLSFNYYHDCGGFFCMLDGRGFPLPFYDDEFLLAAFVINVALWVVIYIIAKNLIHFAKKINSKTS